MSARSPEPRGFAIRRMTGVPAWTAASFVVSLALAVTVLAIFGDGETGTALALRVTARWCFVLFWLAYAGGALAKVCAPRFAMLAHHSREFDWLSRSRCQSISASYCGYWAWRRISGR
jgi:hypothetical protein